MRLLFLCSALLVAVPDRPDPTPKLPMPQEQVYGDWESVGNRTYIWRVAPNETTFIINGAPSAGDALTATAIIDTTKNPIWIDLTPKQSGGRWLGILKLDGDKLTLALGSGGQARPTSFNSGGLVFHYTRVKK